MESSIWRDIALRFILEYHDEMEKNLAAPACDTMCKAAVMIPEACRLQLNRCINALCLACCAQGDQYDLTFTTHSFEN